MLWGQQHGSAELWLHSMQLGGGEGMSEAVTSLLWGPGMWLLQASVKHRLRRRSSSLR